MKVASDLKASALSHHSDAVKEKHQDDATDATSDDAVKESQEYITGFKLLVVTASLTITVFLLFLDHSILGTVSLH
jgi:hypothetical protein